jgi:hypothetical protein
MNIITTKDGTPIYFKDWGERQAVVFSHGWPLSADAWEDQMFFLASRGYPCIARDGAATAFPVSPRTAMTLDTHADDLAALVNELDLKDVCPRRPLHRRRQSRALHKRAWDKASSECRFDRRGADPRQSCWLADRGVRQTARTCPCGPMTVLQGPHDAS